MLRTATLITYLLAKDSAQYRQSFQRGTPLILKLQDCCGTLRICAASLKDMCVDPGCTALSLTTAPPPLSGVMVTHVSDTTIRVSWQPLSLVEAQGHIMYYVMVTPTTGSRRRRQATQGESVCTLLSPCEVPANESSAIVVGLDCDTSYSVTINAVNSEGDVGPTSVPITATIPGRVKQFD